MRVEASSLKEMLHDGAELAIFDVREEGTFARGHLLFAAGLPLSRLELGIADLAPRKGARIVLCDGGPDHSRGGDDSGGDLAERGAERLAALGYSDVAVLAGGTAGWRAAGYELFSGVHVPSKAFGEFVEHHHGTPYITAEDLQARCRAGEDIVILDSRPMAEFQVMNIPGGINCPGAELVYRAPDLAPDPATRIVVNCAGRTRSLIGAQSLINAGIANPVCALRNGTMGWHLAGFELEHGQARRAPEVSGPGLATARQGATRAVEKFGVRTIDRATYETWRAEADERTLYVFDVRGAEEYAAGHLPEARHAPGGQLVQATETYAATRNARVVLVDDTFVRAAMTASWLHQLNLFEVAVLDDALAGQTLATGPREAAMPRAVCEEIAPAALRAMIEAEDVQIVDLAASGDYREGHIPGAWFAVRARLGEALGKLPGGKTLVLTSPDAALARLAGPEAEAILGQGTGGPVKVLEGGTAAWVAAGLRLEEGDERMASTPEDVWLKPYHHSGGVEARMKEYLDWELALVEQIEHDGDARFLTPGE